MAAPFTIRYVAPTGGASRKAKRSPSLGLDLPSLDLLFRKLQSRDRETHRHSARVAWLARRLGLAIGLDSDSLESLHLAGRLHDIGKIALPPSVLNKPGPLSPIEIELMREHPALGCALLEPMPQFRPLLPAIRHHHENYDGTGYPDRLAGETIPLAARILRIADAFDAMTSHRPYRPAMTGEAAMEELRAGAGTDTDPGLTVAFLAMLERIREKHPGEFARWFTPRASAPPVLRLVHPPSEPVLPA